MLFWNNKNHRGEKDEPFEQSEELQTFIVDSPKPSEPIQKHKEEIIVISTSMPLMRRISFISSSVFLAALFLRFLFNYRQLSFIFISLPFSVIVISLIMYLNSTVMLQSFLSKGQLPKLSTITSYICLNSAGLSMLIFICVFALRLDRIISLSLLSVLTPFFLCGSIYLLYAIVLLPAINKEIDCLFNIKTAIDDGSLMLCGFLIGNKIDNDSNYPFAYAFAPVYLCLMLNFVFYFLNKQNRTGDLMRLFGICLIGIGIVGLQLKFDSVVLNQRHWVNIGLIALGYYSISFEFIFGAF